MAWFEILISEIFEKRMILHKTHVEPVQNVCCLKCCQNKVFILPLHLGFWINCRAYVPLQNNTVLASHQVMLKKCAAASFKIFKTFHGKYVEL